MRVTVIADASYCPEHKVGGYGFWIASERGKHGGGGALRCPINNIVAEEMAVVNALYIALQVGLVHAQDEVLMQTDCMGAIDAFRGTRNKLQAQEHEVVSTFNNLKERFSLVLEFRHVKGHSNRREARYTTNRLCDRRAKEAMRKARASKICNNLREQLNGT